MLFLAIFEIITLSPIHSSFCKRFCLELYRKPLHDCTVETVIKEVVLNRHTRGSPICQVYKKGETVEVPVYLVRTAVSRTIMRQR